MNGNPKSHNLLKSFNYAGAILKRLGFSKPAATEPSEMQSVFSRIYLHNEWADPESVSGRGSTLARTTVIREALPGVLKDLGVKTILDAPCGDFNWMREVSLDGFRYIGVDIVPELIKCNRQRFGNRKRKFHVLDISREEVPTADLILTRDCLIHFSYENIFSTLNNFKKSRATYLLATTHVTVEENTDIPTGGWRSVNLRLPPFNFPEPLQMIEEDPLLGKNLGLWRLADL